MAYRHSYGDRQGSYSFSALAFACAVSIAAGFLLCYQFALPLAVSSCTRRAAPSRVLDVVHDTKACVLNSASSCFILQ